MSGIEDQAMVAVTCTLQPPRPWYSEPCMLGIDEAGRGPVLGPMVYAAACCPCSTDLADMELADSKVLSEARRETLLAAIDSDARLVYRSESLSASFISGRMLAPDRESLNALANDSTARLIATVLDAGVNLTRAYIDTVGDADKYKDKLSKLFPAIAFTVCPKADALFPIVSAASVVAKVTRDRVLRTHTCPERRGSLNTEYGCGYPGDAVTKAWLEAARQPLFGFPALVRFSWSTCTPLLENAVRVRWECDDDCDAAGGGQGTLAVWQTSSKGGVAKRKRHSFFRTRRLSGVYMDAAPAKGSLVHSLLPFAEPEVAIG